VLVGVVSALVATLDDVASSVITADVLGGGSEADVGVSGVGAGRECNAIVILVGELIATIAGVRCSLVSVLALSRVASV
jgi:hypothetical protein